MVFSYHQRMFAVSMLSALVVEDNPITRMQAVDVLAEAGILSYTCYSPEAALPILENDHARIRFLFLNAEKSGGIDGFALARATAARWPKIDVVTASENRRPLHGDLPDSALHFAEPFSAAIVRERLRQLEFVFNDVRAITQQAADISSAAHFSEWPSYR